MAKMDQRQKAMLLLTLAALLFLGWQVYNLISDDLSQRPQVANPLTSRAYTSPTSTGAATAAAPLAPVSEQDANPNAATPKAENELPPDLIKSLSFPARPEYLRLANQYEMAKMQRQLLEEEVAIANAQAQILKLGGGASTNSSASVSTSNLSTDADVGLELVSVAQQAGAWTATLNQSGVYKTVAVGTRLPADIEILSIDNEGVLFSQESTRKKLTFNGMIVLSKSTPIKNQPMHQALKSAEQKTTGVVNQAGQSGNE